MSEPVVIAWISLLSLILVPFASALAARLGVRKVSRDVRAVRDQVQNSHSTNLRDEMDSRHQESMAEIGKLGVTVQGVKEDVADVKTEVSGVKLDIGGMRADLRGHADDTRALAGRVLTLEQKGDRDD